MSKKKLETDFINTRQQKVRNAFAKYIVQRVDDLLKLIKVSEKDLHIGMKILKNPARTKNLLITKYNKKTKTYTLVKS